jgi:hypothetical protein
LRVKGRDPIDLRRWRRLLWLPLFLLLFVSSCRSQKDSGPQAAPSMATPETVCSPSASPGATACGAPTTRHAGDKRSEQELASFCQKHCAAQSFNEKDVVPETQAKVGDLTRCPVSGVVFRVTGETPRVEYGGRGRWVCCPGCVEHFRDNPARFSGS